MLEIELNLISDEISDDYNIYSDHALELIDNLLDNSTYQKI